MESRLRRELTTLAIIGSLALLLLLAPPLRTDWPHTVQRLLQAFAVFAFVAQRFWHYRLLNRHDEHAPLLVSLGWANRLTAVRGLLIAVCAGFMLQPTGTGSAAYIPALCYTLAVLLDWFDGVIARRTNNVTLLGAQLDTSVDALGLLIAPVVAVGYGKLHPTYLLVSAAYYLFMWGLHNRRTRGLPIAPLQPSRLRRVLAGLQMGVVAVALWPAIDRQVSQIAGVVCMIPLLAGFGRDWLVVSKRL